MVPTDHQSLQRVGLLFRSVNVSFREAVDVALRAQGVELSFTQVMALSILARSSGLSGAQLARQSMVSPQAMTTVLRQLSTARLLDRRAHPDSLRADSWHVTEKGRKALERSQRALEIVTSRMLSGLTTREIAGLERSLTACARSLGVKG